MTKSLMPVLGVPVLQFALDLLKRDGIHQIVTNTHHLSQQTIQTIKFLEHGQSVTISDESAKLLGSAGGIVKALPFFNQKPFFILNADTLCTLPLKDLAHKHFELKSKYGVTVTLGLFKKSPPDGEYTEIIVDERRGLIRGIGTLAKEKPFYCGVAVIEPDAIKHISTDQPSDFVKEILFPAIQRGRAGFYMVDNSLDEPEFRRWIDIGSPPLWHRAHFTLMNMIESGLAPQIWRDRILKQNFNLKPGVWVSKKTDKDKVPTSWVAPCYWAPDLNETSIPLQLGPNSVLYGSPQEPSWDPSNGIGFRGYWTKIKSD